MVNIGLDHNYTVVTTGAQCSDVLVKMDYNTVTADKGAAVGGTGGDFIEAAARASLAMPGDTYQ